MANKTPIKSTKAAQNAAAKPVAANPAKPRKLSSKLPAPKSKVCKVAKPALLAGGNPQIVRAQ